MAQRTLELKEVLYLTFVRYHGYACEVWAPSTICSITKIESLQRRASKFILNTNWQEDISYLERLSRLNLLPVTYFLSCWPLHVTHVDDYVKPKGTRLTHNSSDQDVLTPKCRTKLFQFSYFKRIAKHCLKLKPRSVLCSAPSSVVFVICSKVIFFLVLF